MIIEHILAVKSKLAEYLGWFAPAWLSFARTVHRPVHDRSCIGNRGRTKTRVTLQSRIYTHNTLNSHNISCLFTYFSHDTLLYCLFVANYSTWNRVSQAVSTVYQQNFAVLFNNGTGTKNGRDL